MQWGQPQWLFLFLMAIYALVARHATWRTRVQTPVAEPQLAFVGLEAIHGLTQETLRRDLRVDEFDEGETATPSPDSR